MANTEEEVESMEQVISRSEIENLTPELPFLNGNWSQKTEDTITLALDQQEIPEDWNISFMTIQPNPFQTLHS